MIARVAQLIGVGPLLAGLIFGAGCRPFKTPDGSAITALLPETGHDNPMAVDQGHLYWYAAESHQLMRMDKHGGPPALVAYRIDDVRQLALDATFLFWTSIGPDGGAVLRTRKDGRPFVETIADRQNHPTAIALDATNVFWVTDEGIKTCPKVDVACAPVTIAALGPGDGLIDSIAVDDQHVYFTRPYRAANHFRGIVGRVSKAGGAAEIVASHQESPRDVAIDATSVYWAVGTSPWDGAIVKLPKDSPGIALDE